MNIEEFQSEEFAKLTFPIFTLGKNDLVLEKFPRLKTVFNNVVIKSEEKILSIDINKVIRYIIFVYDKGSPLIKKIDNLVTRKITGAILAGFEYQDSFERDVDLMMKCRISDINTMIVKYCRLMKSRLYSLVVVSNESFNGTLEEIMSYKTGGKKSLDDQKKKMELIDQAKTTADNIDEWSLQLLSFDTNEQLKEEFYTIVDESDLKLSPEENAEDGGAETQ